MNLIEYLGIETVAVEQNLVILRLAVTDNIKQPFGLVHGGINTVLAETAASMGANYQLNDSHCVGVNISTNHLKSVSSGTLTVKATPIKIGNRLQHWQAIIYDDNQEITSQSTVILMNIVNKKDWKNS